MKRIYFDNAATTPLHPEVIIAMSNAMQENYGNPSSIHAEGRKARAAIEKARKQVASYLGASIGELFFTSGGTESNNMILKGAVRDLSVERIISSETEHPCVLHPLDYLKKYNLIQVDFVKQDNKGRIRLDHLNELLEQNKKKTLVSLMHANNEIGTMINLDEVAALCEKHNALFHSDTVQTIGHYPIDVSKTKIHFLSGSAHKFHGPKGTGFVYIRNDSIVKPHIDGGGQERNMRGGTENTYGILGLAKALELACDNREKNWPYISSLRTYMAEHLLKKIKGVQFNGDFDGSAHYKTLSVSFPPSPKADLLLMNLDIAGISVSGGSACSSGADAGSHVLDVLESDPDRKMIRFSFSHFNTKEEVDVVMKKLIQILQ